MNKLILLNEVKNKKVEYIDSLLTLNEIKNNKEDSNESYITFKEKFNYFQDGEECIDLNSGDLRRIKYSKYENNLKNIMGRVFTLENNIPIIELINSIYNDDLSINAKIEHISNKETIDNGEIILLKNSNYDIKVLAEDEYKKIEYRIQFQVGDDENLAIIINKIDFSDYNNIVSFNKKRKEYESDNRTKENFDKCLIMINSSIEIPDLYEFKLNHKGKNVDCKINIIKGWKYDFKQLCEENMYLLLPLKVLDLRKRLLSLSSEVSLKDLIKDEIFRFFKDMNRYLRKLYDKNCINDKDINELNLIAIDLLNNFITEENNIFVDIKGDIVETLKDIVV